jgi:hypothetical protein
LGFPDQIQGYWGPSKPDVSIPPSAAPAVAPGRLAAPDEIGKAWSPVFICG